MSIFDKFKKKEINRVDELANRLMKEGKVSLLESELKKMNISSLNEKERAAWYEFYGIEAFRRNDRVEALRRFLDAYEKYPNSASIAFSLGQEFQHIGDVAKMIEMFDKAPFPKVSARHVVCAARYCYLWNRYDKSIEYLSQFLKYYYELKCVDDNFLYMRGLPFYSVIWCALGTSFELMNNFNELMKITQESRARLSDYPFDYLIHFLECIQKNNSDKIVEEITKAIEERKKFKMPFSYSLMQIAVLKALNANSNLEGVGLLDEVKIESNDFQWLNDIRLLAKCCLANKFRDLEKEASLKKEFFSKQPLLFEPEHVFDFRLVAYQEVLKKEYREQRKAK